MLSITTTSYYIIAYLIWKGSYNAITSKERGNWIIAYLIWKGSYNALHKVWRSILIIAIVNFAGKRGKAD